MSKKDYEEKISEIKKSDMKDVFSSIKKWKILPANIIRNSENCVGDNIINSKNVYY
jgi:hypothetical protein